MAFDPALSFRENKALQEREFERRYAAWLLSRNKGNISGSARKADMDRKHLRRLLRAIPVQECPPAT